MCQDSTVDFIANVLDVNSKDPVVDRMSVLLNTLKETMRERINSNTIEVVYHLDSVIALLQEKSHTVEKTI